MSSFSREEERKMDDLARILWETLYEKDPTGELFYFFCTRLSVYPKFKAYGIDDRWKFSLKSIKTSNLYEAIEKLEKAEELPLYRGNA